MCLVIHGYFSFFHNFQKGCLGFAGGTVDLVRKEHIAHHRTWAVNEFACLFFVHGKSGYIRRDYIRRKLDPVKIHSHKAAKCQGCGRLSNAWNVFQKHMSSCQHCHDDLIRNFFFSFYNGSKLLLKLSDLICHFFPPALFYWLIQILFLMCQLVSLIS